MTLRNLNGSSSYTKGYVLAIIASITYGLNPLFAVPLYGMGMDVLSVLFYRYAFAVVVLGLFMKFNRVSFSFSRRQIIPIIAAGFLFALSSYTLFESYRFMDVGIASTILYVTPFFVAIIMSTVFHEKLKPRLIICIVAALIGIGMISIKYDSTIQNPLGIGLVILSSFVYSIYIILIKETSIRSMDSSALTFYCLIIGLFFFFSAMGFGINLTAIPSNLSAYANLLGLSVFPTIVSIVAMTIAIKIIGPVPTSVLEALEPVTALIIGGLMFGEKLTFINVLGIIIVISSVSIFILKGKVKNVRQRVD